MPGGSLNGELDALWDFYNKYRYVKSRIRTKGQRP